MDTQSKLLNKQYLETRIRELKEIRIKELEFTIEESDRVFSRSLYINFWCKGKGVEYFKISTLRVSDHEQKICPFTQFIVYPNNTLTKKKKAELMRLLQETVKKGKTNFVKKTINRLTKEKENSNL